LILKAAPVIKELERLSHEIRKMDKEPEEMGLTEFEYTFYTPPNPASGMAILRIWRSWPPKRY
jgi:hypothetical protein